MNEIIGALPGWCSGEKMGLLTQFIKDRNMKLTVEIGVYGGRSLLPQALAHKLYTGGIAIGIDPWTVQDAIQNFPDELSKNALNDSVRETDFGALLQGVYKAIDELDVRAHCELLRMKSSEAIGSFLDNSIDLLHIDGNHSLDSVMEDVKLYIPKVKKGGLIWFDDESWATVMKAIEYAGKFCSSISQNGYCIMERTV